MRKCVCVREGVRLVKRMEKIIEKMFKDQRILATTRMIRLFIFTKRSILCSVFCIRHKGWENDTLIAFLDNLKV